MTELAHYVNYRIAQPTDLPHLRKLDEGNGLPLRSEKWWAARLERDEEIYTMVHAATHTITRRLVGYSVTTWLTHTTIRIDRFFVGNEFRRIRIGTRLLLRVLADKPPQAIRLSYTVPEQDLESHLFLKSVGFVARMPLKHGAFKHTETGIGIQFEWNEAPDAV